MILGGAAHGLQAEDVSGTCGTCEDVCVVAYMRYYEDVCLVLPAVLVRTCVWYCEDVCLVLVRTCVCGIVPAVLVNLFIVV